MLESFMVALNAVAPFMNRLNALNFRLFFPFLMFNNIYSATPEGLPSVTLLIAGPLSVILLILILMLVVPRIVKENSRRGVIIQAVFGAERSSVCGMMVMIMVSLFNIAAVIVLEIFQDGGKVRLKPLLLGLLKNPLLQGCAAGLLFFLLRIRLPGFIASPVSSLATMATTLAMIVLGANLVFEEIRKNRKTITVVLLVRLILLPLITLPLGWLSGLRGVELFLILMIFGTPVATASYPMAQNMGGDGQLAGQLVFVSTVASLGSIFLFIFLMSRLGLLV